MVSHNKYLTSSLSRPVKSILKGGASTQSFVTLLKSKKTFMLQVFITLFLQLFISLYTIYQTKKEIDLLKFAKQNIFLITILNIIVTLVIAFVPMPILPKLLLFTVFSVFNGMLIPVFVPKLTSKDVVDSGTQASLIFASMILVGTIIIYSGIDTTFFNAFLFFASISFIIWSLYILFFQSTDDTEQRNKTFTRYRNISTILFCLYIIYDTYTILSVNYRGDFVTAAFDYYMDIFTIFRNLLIMNNDE